MLSLQRHKRGDAFILPDNSLVETIDGQDQIIPLNDIEIRSQIRTIKAELVAELQVIKHSGGEYFDLVCLNTQEWPTGQHRFDIQFTQSNGFINSTDTIRLPVYRDETLPL